MNNNKGIDIFKQHEISDYLQDILGDEFYNNCKSIFDEIWKTGGYKVFLTKRSFSLMYMFYRDENKDFDNIYTENSIICKAKEIAESYIRCNWFPNIDIVEDILVHGRTVTKVINDLFKSIVSHLRSRGNVQYEYEIRDIFLQSVRIWAIAKNNKPMLLPSNYYMRLMRDPTLKDEWMPQKWHEFMNRISLSISKGYFSNDYFSLSLYEHDVSKYRKLLRDLVFFKYDWKRNYNYEVWTKPIFNGSQIVAFYTVKIVQTPSNYYRITPFIIMADFDYSRAPEKFNKLFNIAPKNLKAQWLYLLLNYNLLQLLQENINNVFDYKNRLDLDKIRHQFKFIDEALVDKPILSWNEMNEFIIASTRTSLSENLISTTDTIEKVISDESNYIEFVAYKEYSRQYGVSATAKKKNISNLFSLVKDLTTINTIGPFIRLIDSCDIWVDVEEHDGLISFMYRPTEQSLSLKPKQNSEVIRTLIEIERDCYFDLNMIKKRVIEFYGDDTLMNFIVEQYMAGQRIADWRINYFKWLEIDTDIEDSEDRNKAKETKMYDSYNKQIKELERYRTKYPIG